MRLFIAIDLPHSIAEEICELYPQERSQIRWIDPAQLHLTLLFLGDQPQHRLDEIIEAITEVSFIPLQLELAGIGHFRSGIVYLDVTLNPLLSQLHQRLYLRLQALGIHTEKRKFKAHITLGRYKKADPLVLQQLEQRARGFKTRFTAESFQLKSSQLKQTGATYHTEADFYPD